MAAMQLSKLCACLGLSAWAVATEVWSSVPCLTICTPSLGQTSSELHTRSWWWCSCSRELRALSNSDSRCWEACSLCDPNWSESSFGHFRSYALKIGVIRDFDDHWKTRVACTIWFSEALGSAEPVAFQKSRGFLRDKNPRRKKKNWNMGKRSAGCKKQSLERKTPAIFRGGGGIRFGPVWTLSGVDFPPLKVEIRAL